MTHTGTIAVADGELYVDDTGETDLVPVVCLHSLFLDHRQFDQFTDAARGRFRVVRLDFRGQGRSGGSPLDVITVESVAGDVMALLDKLEVPRAHFLASSMGGDVGLRVAAYRPDLARSMVITGSSARAEPADQLSEFLQWVADVGERGFVDDVLTTTMRIMLGETTLNDPNKQDIVDLWTSRIAALTPGLRPAMEGVIRRSSALPILGDIKVPALVISGEECIARPPEWAKELADGLPDSELWMMPKIGHSPLLEDADVVNRRVLDFFERN